MRATYYKEVELKHTEHIYDHRWRFLSDGCKQQEQFYLKQSTIWSPTQKVKTVCLYLCGLN